MKRSIYLLFATLVSITTYGQQWSTSSQLSSGTIYKLAILKNGIYEITGSDLSGTMGLDLSTVNPQKVEVLVGHGGVLPESNAENRIDDLVSTPTKGIGLADGKFDAGDKLLFYAEGPSQWIVKDGEYTYRNNIYSDTNFVYLKIDGTANPLQTKSVSGESTYTSTTYDYLQRYESDQVNLLGQFQSTQGTGQQWFGDYYAGGTEINYTEEFNLQGITSSPAQVTYAMAARSDSATTSILTVGGKSITNSYSRSRTTDYEATYAKYRARTDEMILNSDSAIKLKYIGKSIIDKAWLDYIQVVARRDLGEYGPQYEIQDINSIDHAIASFSGLGDYTIWNITAPDQVYEATKQNGSWDYAVDGKVQKFIAYNQTEKPIYKGLVSNQNLHGITRADMIIVTHPLFLEQSQRLANHRASLSGLDVKVVTTNMIYEEFSSGKMDVSAIRDFVRMVSSRDQNLRYLLLMGDGSYDYKDKLIDLPDHNFVPAYQTVQSLNPISGFPADDFYGLLDEREGINLRGDLDVSVGRIPVETAAEAETIVNKIIRYDSGADRYGDWRLKLLFAADDEDGNRHIDDSDDIATKAADLYAEYNQQKVYFDAYEQQSTPGGDRFYDASTAMNNAVQNGLLIVNYLGHGGPFGWAQERVLKEKDIDTWTNQDHMPLLVTATCTFTGYDDPDQLSAGEYAFRKADGGCIGLFTTVRAVFSSQNKLLTETIFDSLLEKLDNNSNTLGDIMLKAKNQVIGMSGSVNNARKFALIGDPSMRLALPQHTIETTEINNRAVGTGLDTLRALELITINGKVTDNQGNLLTDFNGTIYPTVYDKQSSIETLANDPGSSKRSFDIYKNILFKGAASVENGLFTFQFRVPKDINYKYGLGRISYYADNQVDSDAAGYYEGIVIGGSSTLVDDTVGPTMQAYINDRSFINGSIVDKNSNLLIDLEDEFGINVSGNSIGHDLVATLNGSQRFILNDFYKAEINSPNKGSVVYPLSDLSLGEHTLVVKAWDLSNNSSRDTLTFTVVENTEGKIINTSAYPNPAREDVSIAFEHDQLGIESILEVSVYNSSGAEILYLKEDIIPSGNRIVMEFAEKLDKWKDLSPGIYFYKIKLTAKELNTSRISDMKKLVKVH